MCQRRILRDENGSDGSVVQRFGGSIFTSDLMRLRRTLMHENDRRYRLSAIGYRLFSR
jgi:hypothetical protein